MLSERRRSVDIIIILSSITLYTGQFGLLSLRDGLITIKSPPSSDRIHRVKPANYDLSFKLSNICFSICSCVMIDVRNYNAKVQIRKPKHR